MKSDIIARQYTLQNRTSHGKNSTISPHVPCMRKVPVNFTAWKRSVQEEPDLDVLFGFTDGVAKEMRKNHEMVILDPD